MLLTASTELKYLKGVGPQRAAILAKRGLEAVSDLLSYLPFRYEDRIHFSKISQLTAGNTYTVQGTVLDGGLAGFRGHGRAGAIYHLIVQDPTGSLPCKFFHGAYLDKRFRPGQRIVLHGKAEADPRRLGRVEMINPQFEMLAGEDAD